MRRVPLTSVAGLTQDRVSEFHGERRYLATGSLSDSGPIEPQLITWADRPSRADLTVKSGDLCFARMKATQKVKLLDSSDEELILSTGFAVVRPDRHFVDPLFLFHVLRSKDFQDQKDALSHGATQQAITNAGIQQLEIPLPPLDEQRRIAAILDKADEVRSKRKAALETLETLSQAIFVEMFGEPSPPPISIASGLPVHKKGWRWVELTDVARLATGHTPDRDRPDYWNGGIPWISLTEIRGLDGRVAKRTELTVSEEGIAHSSSVILPPGTVCFSRTASVGFVTVAGTEMATSQDFVNWVCGDSLDPIYLMTALLVSRPNLRSLSTGSTHKTIYMRVAEKFRVLLPPMDLQHLFAGQVTDGWKLLDSLERAVEESNHLFSSLQQKAFQGEL